MKVAAARHTVFPLTCLLVAYLILGLFYAWTLMSHDYEAEYLGLGSLALRGELSLYQDEMTGQWVPLPFYVFGVSQLIFGPNLLVPRLMAVALGAVTLALIFSLATRWGGPLAGTAAGAFFCTQGLVMGYFSTVHFASLAAVFHLLGIYILFCTEWRWRDLVGMAVFSVLFLVKPNYWPTIPFVLLFLIWRAGTHRARLAVTAVALTIPVLFFAWDRDHLKLLAYVPILRDWVKPLGYSAWFPLVEDPAAFWRSDYVDLPAGDTSVGRALRILLSASLFFKRYAVWFGALLGLGALAAWGRRRRPRTEERWPPGLRFSFWLFWYLVAAQFVVVGPFIKQVFGYVGPVAPLLALTIGYLFAVVYTRPVFPSPVPATVAACMIAGIVVSPWIHRQPNLPRVVSLRDAPLPALRKAADRVAAVIPPRERRVFLLGDPLVVHLAGRRAYLRQSSQWWLAFTSVRDPARYARSGLWGPSELEQWLGTDATYAILETKMVDFYRSREPYREILGRMDTLLARNFTLVETIAEPSRSRVFVYRRRASGVD